MKEKKKKVYITSNKRILMEAIKEKDVADKKEDKINNKDDGDGIIISVGWY